MRDWAMLEPQTTDVGCGHRCGVNEAIGLVIRSSTERLRRRSELFWRGSGSQPKTRVVMHFETNPVLAVSARYGAATVGLEGAYPMFRVYRAAANLYEDRERAEVKRVLWSQCLTG